MAPLADGVAQDPDLPLPSGPFIAVKAYPGRFGILAGLRTDRGARVLGAGDAPIPGLCAAGMMDGRDRRA